MAGISGTSASARSGWVRRVGVTAALSLAGVFVASAAHAQLPPTPELPAAPELPPEVVDAIAQAEDTLIPILLEAAVAADPATNAAGFALRPGCSAVALPLVLVLASAGDVPLSVGPLTSPLFVMCGSASLEGPADGVFGEVDSAAGAQVESGVQPVLDQVHGAIQPVRPNLNEACGAIAVVGTAPNQIPPPLSRFDVTETVCG